LLNVAIVGCGQIARAHLAALAAVPSARVVAVCDRDLDRARELALRTPGAAVERALEAALAQERIDVVHVLTPPAAHAAVAIQAAEAGCDVLVEKPMALDVAEAERIIDAARAAGVRVVPNHNYLFKPSIERARTIVASGGIGDVVAVNTFYGISGERSAYGASALRSHWAWSLPGGVFTNFLPHLAYLQLEFLGGPPRVVGATFGGDPNDPTEVIVQVAHHGALGTMTVSMRARPYMKYVEIFGTRGMVHADLVREVAYVHRDRPLPSMIARSQLPRSRRRRASPRGGCHACRSCTSPSASCTRASNPGPTRQRPQTKDARSLASSRTFGPSCRPLWHRDQSHGCRPDRALTLNSEPGPSLAGTCW
jgi:predicted dehydrogenase